MVNLNMMWLVFFWFWFRLFTCTVQLLSNSLFTSWSYVNKTSWQLHAHKYEATEKQTVKLQLNEKKSKESHTRLMSWYWKRMSTWRKGLIAYNSHCSLINTLSIGPVSISDLLSYSRYQTIRVVKFLFRQSMAS